MTQLQSIQLSLLQAVYTEGLIGIPCSAWTLIGGNVVVSARIRDISNSTFKTITIYFCFFFLVHNESVLLTFEYQ